MRHKRKSLTRQTSRHLRSLTLIVTVLVINFSVHAEEPLSGREFKHRLRSTIGLTWASNPLRRALNSLSSSQRIAIMLDRRVDPTQLLNLKIENKDLETTIQLIAERQGLEACYVDSVVYFGPPETVSKLGTLAALRITEVDGAPASIRSNLQGKSSYEWDDLTTPKELISKCTEQMRIRIQNPERIPHDLWAKNKLPQISRIEFLTLMLAGFDLTWNWRNNGREIELIPIPQSVSLTKTIPKKISSKILNDLRQRYPQATITLQNDNVTVRGTSEDIDAITTLLNGGQVSNTQVVNNKPNGQPTQQPKTVYSLAIEKQPVGGVLKSLASSLKLKLVYSDEVTLEDKQRLISFQVKDASTDELLAATVAPANLKHTIVGGELRVTK